MGENQELPKLSRSVLNIPGTKPNIQSGQLLISSGIPSLDEVLGGGLPVGTLVLVEEDQQGVYAKIILKYFLAEAVVSKHSIFIASQDISTDSIIYELPDVCDAEPEPGQQNEVPDDKMKIAFRYTNVPKPENKKQLSEFGHFYDLTKVMTPDIIAASDIVQWQNESKDAPATFSNPAYHELLQSIRTKLQNGKFGVADKPETRSVLRVGIHALGSPMWFASDSSGFGINQRRDLDMFIFCLRALVRSAFAVAFVTIPSHLIDANSLSRSIYSSDVAVRLQEFAGTELEKNSVLSDYNGYFHVVKMAAINTFVSKHPGSVEYAFKLRRKKFSIEKLHLPPDIEEINKIANTKKAPSMGCGSSDKHLLEF